MRKLMLRRLRDQAARFLRRNAEQRGGLLNVAVGQAHDGIMSVPESGTWNLQKGERVLPEYTAKRLDRTLDDVSKKGNGGGNVNIVFENHTSATISQAPSKDGEMRFIIRDEIDNYVPQQLSRTNTPISQALLQNTTATRRV